MNRARLWAMAFAGIASACNPAGRAGPGGVSGDGRAAAVLAAEAPRERWDAAGTETPPPAVSPAPPPNGPPMNGTHAPSAARPSASSPPADTSPLISQCPHNFGLPRYANCKWSTGMYRYCGGAAPLDGDDQPREGCVCNECLHDRDCDKRSSGRCLAFPDEACGPPAKGCVYAGDPCARASGCKQPDRCQHDDLGHPSCAAPPVPHM